MSLFEVDVHVFSDSVLCVGCRNANEAAATKITEVWNPMTFIDKYDITGPSVQFHWHLFLGTQRSRSKMGSNGSEDPQNRMTSLVESYSCRCSTTLIGGQKTRSKAVLECNISFPTRETCQVRSLVWTKQEKCGIAGGWAK